jgi:prolyl oligopeptidase PreP (S9A serine peptidase family)
MAAMLTHSGGVYCVANIRGGGEFGEDWHKAAIREKRPVAFADFEECGRYLIREGWTRKEKLVCQGGSNGGALVGAVMNRTGDEIFAAGIAQVGYLLSCQASSDRTQCFGFVAISFVHYWICLEIRLRGSRCQGGL